MLEFLNIPNIDSYIVLGILLIFGLIETLSGHYSNSQRKSDDWIMEGLGFIMVSLIKALIFFGAFILGKLIFPSLMGSFAAWGLLLSFLFYILIDDILQYWYHRLAHEYTWLWKHHRPHHAAEEMGILVSYRNSAIYYLIMPNIWWAGICSFLGMGPAVILGLIVKQLIVTSSHSTWKWDESMYRSKWLRPLSILVQRIFITPAFHHAHHGKSKADHIGDPNGNFGNAFSIWDQMFGTAIFTEKYPVSYGLQTDPKDSWASHLFFPFVRSNRKGSQISKDYRRTKNTGTSPVKQELAAGTYLYCACGYSDNQPFCNGSHHGTKHKPILFEISATRNVSLCTCKLSKTAPFCDGSHKSLSS